MMGKKICNICCCVPQCKVNFSKQRKISFHSFPKCPETKQRWIEALKIGKVSERARVCSRHFYPANFSPRCPDSTQKRSLLNGSIPSRNLPVPTPPGTRSDTGDQHQGDESHQTDRHRKEFCSDQDVTVKVEPDDELAGLSPDGTCTPLDSEDVAEGDHVYCQLPLDKSADGDGEELHGPLLTSALPSGEATPGTGPVKRRARKQLAEWIPPPADPPVSVPPPLTFQHGELARHLAAMQKKQRQLQKLKDAYSSLVRKAEFRSRRPDWTEGDPPPKPSEPLVTLRGGRADRFPTLAPVDPLSWDLMLPLSPSDAWRTVATLRQQLLDLQLRVMHAQVMVVAGELRMQENDTLHRRFKINAQKELQSTVRAHVNSVRTHMKSVLLKRSRCQRFLNRPTNRTRQMEKLVERMEDIFTPMQLRVIRTGRKPKWAQEDIRRAIDLRLHLSRKDYDFVRKRLCIPLPSPKIMRQAVKRFTSLKPLFDGMVDADKTSSDCEPKKDASPLPNRNGKPTEPPKKTSSESLRAEQPVVGREKATRKLPLRRSWSSPSRSPKQSPLARTPRPSQQLCDTSEGATASPPAHKRSRVMLVVPKGAAAVASRCSPGTSVRVISEGRGPTIVTGTKNSPQPCSGQPCRPGILRKRPIDGKTPEEGSARPPSVK